MGLSYRIILKKSNEMFHNQQGKNEAIFSEHSVHGHCGAGILPAENRISLDIVGGGKKQAGCLHHNANIG